MAIFSWLTSLLLPFILFRLTIAFGSGFNDLGWGFDYSKTCPPFQCGDIKEITYPFTNVTHPECGIFKIECVQSRPTFQMVKTGRTFTVKRISYHERLILIQDHQLHKQLEVKDCNSLEKFSIPKFLFHGPGSDLYMKLTTPTITIFNCKNYTLPLPPHVQFKISNYTGCKNSVLYFIPELDTLPPQSFPIPPECRVFQIPMPDSSLLFNQNWTDDGLLPLLNKGFNLTWWPHPFCQKCHDEGRLCWKKYATGNIWCCGKDCRSLKSNSPGDPDKTKLAIIVVGSSIETVTIFILLLCLPRKKFFVKNLVFLWKKREDDSQNVELFLKANGSLSPQRYNYKDVMKMTNSFRDKLGQGGYGAVYKGKLLDSTLVAVKVLSESKGNGDEFINEVAIIGRTAHINIVSLLGFCSEGCKRALIYEFMPNGSLEKFIYTNGTRTSQGLGWEKLHHVAIGTARGLEYLHRGCNTRIFHFDIKPHNILLDKDFCPKISDFGLAKLCPTRQSTISIRDARGTAGYIAPEVFYRNVGGVSSKSDVYSYGMMVLEMVGGRKNFKIEVENTSETFFPHWIRRRLDLDEDLGLGEHLTKEEEEIVRKMIIVGLWCIQMYPANRPSMSRVLEMLEGSLEGLQMPPKPIPDSPYISNEVTMTIL